METGLKCPIRPCRGYSVLKLDEDDNTFKATLLNFKLGPNGEYVDWTFTENRVLYDQAHVIYDFHIFNENGDRVNYVIIRDEGLLAYIGDVIFPNVSLTILNNEESGLKCPIRPFSGYSVLRLDEDKSTFKATLLLFGCDARDVRDVREVTVKWTITEIRAIYDQAHIVYEFHNDGNNYVIIRSKGLLADIGDEKSFILWDK